MGVRDFIRELLWTPTQEKAARLQAQAYDKAYRGEYSAQCLAPVNRDRLIGELRGEGWSDEQIATHTKLPLWKVRGT